MSCPLFSNNIKKCNNILGESVNKIDSSACQSNQDYNDCIFYKLIHQNKKEQCKHMEICSYVAVKAVLSLPITEVKELAETFCLTPDNQKNCAIYQYLDKLKRVPNGLLPNGKVIKTK